MTAFIYLLRTSGVERRARLGSDLDNVQGRSFDQRVASRRLMLVRGLP